MGTVFFFFFLNWGWCWLSGRSFAAPLVSSVKIPAASTTIPTPQVMASGMIKAPIP